MAKHAICLLALVAGCAAPPAGRDVPSPLAVQDHAFEVPRVPHPRYQPDGVAITRIEGDSVWMEAGLDVGDVIESVNGEATLNARDFWKAAGGDRPRRVRVRSRRAGAYGTRKPGLITKARILAGPDRRSLRRSSSQTRG